MTKVDGWVWGVPRRTGGTNTSTERSVEGKTEREPHEQYHLYRRSGRCRHRGIVLFRPKLSVGPVVPRQRFEVLGAIDTSDHCYDRRHGSGR